VSVDTTGEISFLAEVRGKRHRGLTVSPDERFCAYSDREEVHVLNTKTGNTLTPYIPDDIHASYPEFSPSGQFLAAVSIRPEAPCVLVCRTPEFTEFSVIYESERWQPLKVRWSQDSEWLLVLVAPIRKPGPLDLIAVEVATGEALRIERPYSIGGHPALLHGIAEGFDWID
jgi:hypothetical protein